MILLVDYTNVVCSLAGRGGEGKTEVPVPAHKLSHSHSGFRLLLFECLKILMFSVFLFVSTRKRTVNEANLVYFWR
jgi:hypothetical protein